jgi:putative membrane protein
MARMTEIWHLAAKFDKDEWRAKNMLKWKKYICIALSATMMASMTVGCGKNTDSAETKTDVEATEQVDDSEDEDTLTDTIMSEISDDETEDADKEETVYVMSDASGNVDNVKVSAWLKNADKSKGLADYTTLTDVENVKGYESYTENDDGSITWAADGADIYYQGNSTKELPVDVKITYTLDGKEISPEDLAGKSGKVTIRFDYVNNSKTTVKVGDTTQEIVSPFVMMSGMLLPVDKFSNVQVENGKVMSEGSNQIVVGYAVPGLKDCLYSGLKDDKIAKAIENLSIPDYVQVTADVEDFELSMTMTVASSDLLGEGGEAAAEDIENSTDVDIDSLDSDMTQLSDSADQLQDGSGELTNGLETLKDGTYSLNSGAKTLADGASSIKTYTSQLADGTSKISTAITSLDDGIKSIKTGSAALKDGSKTLADGAKTVDTGVKDIYDGENELKTGVDALVAGYNGTKETTGAVDGAKSLADGTKTLYTNSQKLAKGAKDVSDGISTLITTMTSMPATVIENATASVYSQLAAYGISDAAGIDAAMTQIAGALSLGPDALGGTEAYNQYLAQYKALAQAQGALNAINQIGTALTQAMSSEEVQTSTKALTDGAKSVADGSSALSTGIKTASDGASSLYSGVTQLSTGTKQVQTGMASLMKGTSTLKTGTKSLSDGATTIYTNMTTLYNGTVTLADGSGQLLTASNTLDSSAKQIAAGAKTLSDGATELASGASSLDSGAGELVSGSTSLSDGMAKFNEEGIKKLTDMFAGDYQYDMDYIEAVFSKDASYTSYGGNLEGTDCSVKFIYESAAIKSE